MPSHPLAEIFGFPFDNLSHNAERFRNLKMCPYNNKVPSCTKNSAKNPLGVCSVFENNAPVITCPIRFREDWRIIEDAAKFFFDKNAMFTSLAEVRLNDLEGNSAGNIDFVLVSIDKSGEIADFGALEVQAVYISGNVSNPFSYYMENRNKQTDFSWSGFVRPDFLSSSRKRLVPQLINKGHIFREWKKKIAFVIQDSFYNTLPKLPSISPNNADIAWFIYKLEYDENTNTYHLVRDKVVYTRFNDALNGITFPKVGNINSFAKLLQTKIEDQQEIYPPINLTLMDTFTDKE